MTSNPRALPGLVGRLLVCAVLVTLAAGFWLASRSERQLAQFDQALSTLRYDTPGEDYAAFEAGMKYTPALPWFDALRRGGHQRRDVASYWGAAPQLSGAGTDAFLAANRAFRDAQRARDRATALRQLDEVQKKYAEVVKNDPARLDAAYNYEYVARLRARLAKARDLRALTAPAGAPSIHGHAGAPPPGTDVKQFKMFVPMQPDERKNVQPDAGKGEKKPRKG